MRLLCSPLLIVVVSLVLNSSANAEHHSRKKHPLAAELFVNNKASAITEEANTLNLQGLSAMQDEDFSTAEKLFSKAHSIDRYNTSALYNLSTVYLISNKSNAALELLVEGTKNFPEDAHLVSRLGDVYFTMKALVLAQKKYQLAYRMNPALTQTALRLTTTLILQKKRDEAVTVLDGLLTRDILDHRLLGGIAALYLSSGNISKGVTIANRSIQIHPTKEVYISLGSGYELAGDNEKARDAFIKAAAMGQPTEELKRKIQALS